MELCPFFEEKWRSLAPTVVAQLTARDQVCVIWAAGPMDESCLPLVVPYIVSEDNNRYHIEQVTFTSDEGYTSSWVSFEFWLSRFQKLMADKFVDLEMTQLSALILDPAVVPNVLSKPLWTVDFAWWIERGFLALSSMPHFEGWYVLGQRSAVLRAVERVTV